MQDFIADQLSRTQLASRTPLDPQAPETAHDFAGLLAALAAEKPGLPAWSNEELSGDVAELSYERALRTHARYKSADHIDECPEPAGRSASVRSRNPASERERKCASVTLRMSKAECEQLRVRAAEAGLTVSAYLRLCAFEADALRAQVKDVLAELRKTHKPETESASHVGTKTTTAGNSGSRLGWLRWMMPDLHPARNLVRA